ncbi:MAG: 4Fe-4S binding protein [Candidatus Promineifilaceae bacterium]
MEEPFMASGRIVINQDRCKGCALCIETCPPGVIRFADHLNAMGYRPAELYDPAFQCTGCALCAMVCPDASITVYRDLPTARAERRILEAV